MGLTGGVRTHRLSGLMSPYCEKEKRHGLCSHCVPMLLRSTRENAFLILFLVSCVLQDRKIPDFL